MKRLAQFNLNRILTTKGFNCISGGNGDTDAIWTNAVGITIQRYNVPNGIAVAISDETGSEIGRYYVSQSGERNQQGVDDFMEVLQQYL